MDILSEVRPLLDKENSPNISLKAIDVEGLGNRVINPNTAVYTCSEGIVTFVTGDDKHLSFTTLKPGEQIKIPPNTPYLDYCAEKKPATVISVNVPAFDSEKIILVPITKIVISEIKKEIGVQRFKRLLTSSHS